MAFIILDTENNCKRDKWGNFLKDQDIIEFSYIMLDDDLNVISQEDTLISDVAETIHECQKINLKDIREKGKPWNDVFTSFVKDALLCTYDNAKIIAHNFDFDFKIMLDAARKKKINKDVIECFSRIMNKKGYCSMKKTVNYCRIPLHNKITGERFKYPSLIELHKDLYHHKRYIDQKHRARPDVQLLFECVKKMKELKMIK